MNDFNKIVNTHTSKPSQQHTHNESFTTARSQSKASQHTQPKPINLLFNFCYV